MPCSEALIRKLQQAGLYAFPDFPKAHRPVPPHGCFVTLAEEKTDYAAPIPAKNGYACPFLYQLCVCTYAKADTDIREASAQAEAVLLDALTEENCDVRSVQRGMIRYGKNTDCLSQECIIIIRGMMYCLPDEGDDDADHD